MGEVTHVYNREEIIANREDELRQMVGEYNGLKRRIEYLAQFIMTRGIELRQIKQTRRPIQLTFEDIELEGELPPGAL